MKVSVVIPTYNRRGHIARAIDCVLAQSVPVDEIVVVDDGSTDGTADLVEQRYGPQVRLFRRANAGVSAARNLGIRVSRGEWIGFLDSDDWWHPDKLKRQFEAIKFFGGIPSVCFTDNSYGGHPGMTMSRFEEVGFLDSPPIGVLEDTLERIISGQEPFFTSSFLIRRALLNEVGGFDEVLTIREDTDILFRLCLKTKFCFAREPLTEIDRTPSRSIGLCKLYGTREDVVFDCSERIYKKWLSMPEIVGSEYEGQLRGLLLDVHFGSAESKIHQLRFKAALRSLAPVKEMGYGPASIVATLASRKIHKLKRDWTKKLRRSANQSEQPRVAVT